MNSGGAPELETLYEEGLRLVDAEQFTTALIFLRKALQGHPDQADLLALLGEVYLKLDRKDDALQASERALASDSCCPSALLVKGRVLQSMARNPEAEQCYRKLVLLKPELKEASEHLARVLLAMRKEAEALEILNAIPAHRFDGELHFMRAFALSRLLRLQEALNEYALALEKGADPLWVRWNSGNVKLLLGRWTEAWDDRELRYEVSGAEKRDFDQPEWDGSSLQDQSILLHGLGEGHGDTIMALRYGSLLKKMGGRVLVETRPDLAGLLKTCPYVDEVILAGSPLPPFDRHAHLMSLPKWFKTSPETVPAEIPYLASPPIEVIPQAHVIRERIEAAKTSVSRCPGITRSSRCVSGISSRSEPTKITPVISQRLLKIGLVHAGSPGHQDDACRSIPPQLFEVLAPLRSSATFFSLQKARPDPLPPLPESLAAIDLGDLLSDFSHTAYALDLLDLLITVDTSVAHVAGAMGLPVLLLLPFLPDWRWMLNRKDTPWYPTMRLYRQTRPGDWEAVLAHVLEELR